MTAWKLVTDNTLISEICSYTVNKCIVLSNNFFFFISKRNTNLCLLFIAVKNGGKVRLSFRLGMNALLVLPSFVSLNLLLLLHAF